jgi:hypothetical protein
MNEAQYLQEQAALAAKYNADQVVLYLLGDKFKATGAVKASSLAPVLGPAVGPILASSLGKMFGGGGGNK